MPALCALLFAGAFAPQARAATFEVAPAAEGAMLAAPLAPAEASLRFAEFFAAPWPKLGSLEPALPFLEDPQVRTIFRQAVARLLKDASGLEPRRDFKLAVLRLPALQAAMDDGLRAAVAADQAKAETRHWEAVTAEVDAAVRDWGWRSGEDAAAIVEAPGSPASTALVLRPSEAAPAPGRGERIFSKLPSPIRSALARRGGAWRETQIRSLIREVASLLPDGALLSMAGLPQTSHDYLVQDHLPKVPEAAEMAAREIARHPEWPDYMVSGARPDADKQAWFERLADAKKKLEEIASLQSGQDPPEQRAAVQLALGVLHSFSYGFASGLEHRHFDAGHDSLRGGNQDFVDRATSQLRAALSIFESMGNEPAALATRYLLGKHAVNGRHAYSNPGLYDWNWRKVPEEPQAFEYEALARSMLESVATAVRSRAAGTREVYFEARYFLLKLDDTRNTPALSALITEYLLETPRERVAARLAKGDRYALIERLMSDLRWALQLSGDDRMRDALFDERYKGQPMTYDRLIEVLVDAADCDGLRPLLNRAPRLAP